MKEYKDLVTTVLENGALRRDRTGTGTISLFGAQVRLDLRTGFPALTTKRVCWRNAVKETLWFLRGETHVSTLGCGIWDAWAGDNGELGPVYGSQWRHWMGLRSKCDNSPLHTWVSETDQFRTTISAIKSDPYSRRHIVSAWNVSQLQDMALPPCHVLFQLYVSPGADGKPEWLDLQWYQRSADIALGVPFNWIGYALVCHLIARECGLKPRYLIHSIGDAHVYTNHVEPIRAQIARTERPLPRLVLPEQGLDELLTMDHTASDLFELDGYDPHPGVRYEIAV